MAGVNETTIENALNAWGMGWVDANVVEPEDSRNPAGRIRVHRMRVGYGERPNVFCRSCDPASNISEVVTAICALSGQNICSAALLLAQASSDHLFEESVQGSWLTTEDGAQGNSAPHKTDDYRCRDYRCRDSQGSGALHLRTRQRTIKKSGARRPALFPNAPAATLARAGCSGIQLPARVLASGRARPIRIRIRTGNTAGCPPPAGSGPASVVLSIVCRRTESTQNHLRSLIRYALPAL